MYILPYKLINFKVISIIFIELKKIRYKKKTQKNIRILRDKLCLYWIYIVYLSQKDNTLIFNISWY